MWDHKTCLSKFKRTEITDVSSLTTVEWNIKAITEGKLETSQNGEIKQDTWKKKQHVQKKEMKRNAKYFEINESESIPKFMGCNKSSA